MRSIPTKGGGVLALVFSILVLLRLPLRVWAYIGCLRIRVNPLNQVLFWSFVRVFAVLTWIGKCPVEEPFTFIGQTFTTLYFFFFFFYPAAMQLWWKFVSVSSPGVKDNF